MGAKASFNRPTGLGETPRLAVLLVTSMVLAWRIGTSSADVTESTSVASVESRESIVDEVINGEDKVNRPAWELCGDMPGRFGCGLEVG